MSVSTLIFYALLTLWSFYATYFIVFKILPAFGKKQPHAAPSVPKSRAQHAQPQHSAYDGFRAYARNGELTVDDIVKALSRD